MAKVKGMFRDAGLKMVCSPSDRTTKVPNARVGMAVQNEIVFVKAEKKCEAFRDAYEAGRVDKYLVDLGWEQNLFCFVIYMANQEAAQNQKKKLKPLRLP